MLGTISGCVLNFSDNTRVANAKVTLCFPETRNMYTVSADPSGVFSFPNIEPQGVFLISASDDSGATGSVQKDLLKGGQEVSVIVLTDQPEPAEILLQLNSGVRSALQQETGDTTDGMDVCLCRIHSDRRQVTFAGANRPLYHFSRQQLRLIKGDRKYVGGKPRKKEPRNFTNHNISLLPGDILYLGSDGLPDQPNPDNQPFGNNRLANLLNEVATHPTGEQKRLILARLEEHQKNTEQRDDITVIGVRI